MIIRDLDYLEVITEETSVEGGHGSSTPSPFSLAFGFGQGAYASAGATAEAHGGFSSYTFSNSGTLTSTTCADAPGVYCPDSYSFSSSVSSAR